MKEFLKNDQEGRDMFDNMVEDWKADHAGDEEYTDLVYAGSPEYDDELKRWYLPCEDAKCVYALVDAGCGNIEIEYIGTKTCSKETSNTRARVFFCDMDSKGFERNDQLRSENLACEIFEDDLYGIDDFYADSADVQLEPLAEYGRGWYTYTTDDEQQRYVYVDRIEKPDPEYPGEWIINGDRWKEYGHEFSAAELAEIGGKSVQSVYNLARKLGRLPSPDELKAVRRGAPRKYH